MMERNKHSHKIQASLEASLLDVPFEKASLPIYVQYKYININININSAKKKKPKYKITQK